jgi:hypothetical protein
VAQSSAPRVRRWREAKPERNEVLRRRSNARTAAARKLIKRNPALYEALYREECAERGVTPYGNTTEGLTEGGDE